MRMGKRGRDIQVGYKFPLRAPGLGYLNKRKPGMEFLGKRFDDLFRILYSYLLIRSETGTGLPWQTKNNRDKRPREANLDYYFLRSWIEVSRL